MMRKKFFFGVLILMLMSSCFVAGVSFRIAQAAENKLTDDALYWEANSF